MPLNDLPERMRESAEDTRLRPYTTGMMRHPESLATIILYENSDIGAIDQTQSELDYYTDFASPISNIKSSEVNPLTSGTPDNNAGSNVARIDLDGSGDNSEPYYGVFNNFSLINVQESSEQILKMHVNFGANWNAFFFGEKPKIYLFNGFFLDSMEYPYYQEFLVAYNKFLAGRKVIEENMSTKFVYDGKIVDGYMINITTEHTAADQLMKKFNFTVLVKGETWIRNNIVQNKNGGMERVFNGLRNRHRLQNANAENPGFDFRDAQ